MASTTAHLAHLEPWFEHWLEPAHHLVFRDDVETALACVAIAADELEATNSFTPDEKQLLRYEIGFTPFNFLNFAYCDDRARQAFEEARRVLDTAPAGPLSAPLRAFYRLALTAHGVRLGFMETDLDTVRELATGVPADRIVNAYWMHLATLGYYLDVPQLVEEAFGELLTSTTGLRDSWGWLRANLMHLLIMRRATAQDFVELLKNLQHAGELRSFVYDFWGPAEELGFAAELQQLLEQRQTELATVLTPPEIEPRTRRVLGKHMNKH